MNRLKSWGWNDHGVGEIVVYDKYDMSAICILDDTDKTYSWPEDYSVGPEAKQNAKLIAAAPDLYEALEKLRVWSLDNNIVPTEIVADVEYALAKARGE